MYKWGHTGLVYEENCFFCFNGMDVWQGLGGRIGLADKFS